MSGHGLILAISREKSENLPRHSSYSGSDAQLSDAIGLQFLNPLSSWLEGRGYDSQVQRRKQDNEQRYK